MNTSFRFVAAGLIAISIAAGTGTVQARSVKVVPETSVIVIPSASDPREELKLMEAATELQKHLALVTGSEIPIKQAADNSGSGYAFYVGITPETPESELIEQETRWVVTPETTHLFGEGRSGTLYAVYSFLEDQVGIRWIAPGDDGIVYREQNPLTLTPGTFNWIPELQYRSIRLGDARKTDSVYKPDNEEIALFYPDLEEHNAFARDVFQWQMRMRMYGSRPGGSHAFSSWWKKYGQTHPEYFALNKYGKREPVPLAKGKKRSEEFIKICASNPDVARQVIEDWLPVSHRQQYVSVGVNDGNSNFCECEDCRELDVTQEGEAWHEHLTDRYVVLANRVARMAREHRPDAYAAMYAYHSTLYPPRREKLEPNIVVQLVPYVDPLDLDTVRSHFEGWKQAGATKLVLRPNYHHKYLTTAMPTGVEQQMFDVFQLAYQNGCIATDYDSLRHQWAVTGITDYILAKSFAEPTKPFEHWATQYYSAFGAAAEEVRDYYEYWRHEVWAKRLQPNIITICNLGGAGNFDRGLFWSLNKYYSPEDFAHTDKILERAAKRNLTPRAAGRVRQLQLANEHARLTYQAVVANPFNKAEDAEKLMDFRTTHKNDLLLSWKHVIGFELSNGDLTGIKSADEMKGYLKPWLPTELFWRFRLDEQDVGVRENWEKLTWTETADWHKFRTDRAWENQVEFDEPSGLPEEVTRVITSYDGIGWYSTRVSVPGDWKDRQIFLRFGAVDESCWVYVNGKPAGRHLYTNTDDWKTPFEIKINDQINWEEPSQVVTVRVEDKSGLGGIWRRVWLVSKSK